MFGNLLQPEATFCFRLQKKSVWRPQGSLQATALPQTPSWIKGVRKRRAGKGQKKSMDNPLCHQFLHPPLLTHARAYNYILAAVLLSEGLEVKLSLHWSYDAIGCSDLCPLSILQQSRDEPHWLQGWGSCGGYSHCLFAFFLEFINQNKWIYRSILVSSDVIETIHQRQAGH